MLIELHQYPPQIFCYWDGEQQSSIPSILLGWKTASPNVFHFSQKYPQSSQQKNLEIR